MKTTEVISEIVSKKIGELGFELYDVELEKERGSLNLVIYIDRPEGVDLDDCEKVSRAIDPLLDESDPIKEPYCLCVSSVGIDRPLKLDRDFERNMNGEIEVKLYAPLNGQKYFRGKLISFDKESFAIDADGTSVAISRKAAALIRPYIEF